MRTEWIEKKAGCEDIIRKELRDTALKEARDLEDVLFSG